MSFEAQMIVDGLAFEEMMGKRLALEAEMIDEGLPLAVETRIACQGLPLAINA